MKKRSKKINFASLFIKYKGKWIALDKKESSVIASGKRVSEVVHQAQKKGVEVPILFKVPRKLIPFIGFIIND